MHMILTVAVNESDDYIPEKGHRSLKCLVASNMGVNEGLADKVDCDPQSALMDSRRNGVLLQLGLIVFLRPFIL